MSDSKTKRLVDELAAAKNEYHLLTTDEESPQQLAPAATPTQLASLERRLGRLPASYRAFLELHNGWAGFDGNAKLLSTEDHEEDWVRERIADLGAAAEDAGAPDPFETGAPVLLGESEQNFVLMLSPRDETGSGREFVSYDLQDEMQRFPDFVAFLEHELELVREMIRRAKPRGGHGEA